MTASKECGEAVRARLASKLQHLSGSRLTIAPELDVVYDLGLNGADLYELMAWVNCKWGVDFSKVSSRDLPLDEPPPAGRTLFGKKRFKSMTVGGLLSAIESKCWSFE